MSTSEIGILVANTAEQIMSRDYQPGQSGTDASFPAPFDEKLWAVLEEAGLTAALEPAANADLGIPAADALALVRIVARHGAPVPLAETLVANWLAKDAGLEAPSGPLTLAPNHRLERLELVQDGQNWRITGTARHVPFARDAAGFVIVADHDGQDYVAVVDASGVTVTPKDNVAGEARDTVVFSASLTQDAVARHDGARNQLHEMGALVRAVQMSGAMEAILDMTMEYAPQRVQFGKPITKFQAVQNNIAAIMSQMSAARASVEYVLATFERGDRGNAIAAAKIRTGEAATIVSRQAHQVQGAIGFTQDYALHTLTRRLWAWSDEFGNETEWMHRLGSALFARPDQGLWAFITEDI